MPLQLLKEYNGMKDYYNLILEKLLTIYERRETFAKDITEVRAIQINPAKEYKEYIDHYNHNAYKDINVAIEKLERQAIICTVRDITGKYTKVKLDLAHITEAYALAKRISVPELCKNMKLILKKYKDNEDRLIQTVVSDFNKQLEVYKKLPYEIKFDGQKLDLVLCTLSAIVTLNKETYIRNFSTALFKDSKVFQNTMRSIIESILYDYSDIVIEKEKILEVYNLFDNPTYVLLKGEAVLRYKHSSILLADMNGGMAIPNSALADILSIEVMANKIITVENLTTYHDSDESNSMFIYLGGFHNQSKQQFLKLLFSQNPEKKYYHKGDLDVYGFLILENLKDKTGIPFEPLEMDVRTLEKFYRHGLYKPLTFSDKKAMESIRLQKYSDVFDFMRNHNCKVEQESIKALELLEQL